MSNVFVPPERDDIIRGVFSAKVKTTLGFGVSKRSSVETILFFVEEQEDGRIGVQPLNKNYVPCGELKFISKEELLKNYQPEPDIYMEKVYPAIRQMTNTIVKAEAHLKRGNVYSAEYEFKNALRVDEANIRATFGLGLSYLERGETEKGDLVFRRIVKLKGAFEKTHKHLFNDFGIKLRKNGMYSQAMRYYSRAYRLSKTDEHLLYNMARTLYEKQNYKSALVFLNKALALRKDFSVANDLKIIIERKLSKKR